jgi:hypothetical protein
VSCLVSVMQQAHDTQCSMERCENETQMWSLLGRFKQLLCLPQWQTRRKHRQKGSWRVGWPVQLKEWTDSHADARALDEI